VRSKNDQFLSWRWIYVATAIFALYLNVFVWLGVLAATRFHPLQPPASAA
jgi:hypothetical protein